MYLFICFLSLPWLSGQPPLLSPLFSKVGKYASPKFVFWQVLSITRTKLIGHPTGLELNPSASPYKLWDLEQLLMPLWALVSSLLVAIAMSVLDADMRCPRSHFRKEEPAPSLLEALSSAQPQLSIFLAAASAQRRATSPKDVPSSQGRCVLLPSGRSSGRLSWL